MANRIGVLVALAFSLSGCPSPNGNDAGSDVPTPLAFCEKYASPQFACDFLPGCGLYASRESCLTQLGAQDNVADCAASLAVFDSAAGWVRYDAAEATRCLNDIKTTCEQFPRSCLNVFSGARTEGQSCHTDTCVTGFYCASDGGCPGSCAPKKPEGTIVRSSSMCIEGTEAHFGLPDGGFGTYCQKPVGEGQPCANTECEDGLFCDADDKCAKPYGIGEKCTNPGEYAECEVKFGTVCQPSLDGGDNRCGKRAKRGEACGYCTVDLRCVIAQGQSAGTCGDLGASGDSCRFDEECTSGLYCHSQKCETPRDVGSDCAGGAQCVTGARCQFEFPGDGGSTVEYHCRATDAGVINVSYCVQTEP